VFFITCARGKPIGNLRGIFEEGSYAERSQALFIKLGLGCPWFSEISGEYSASVDTECSDFA
jgi:hypothetical protein